MEGREGSETGSVEPQAKGTGGGPSDRKSKLWLLPEDPGQQSLGKEEVQPGVEEK